MEYRDLDESKDGETPRDSAEILKDLTEIEKLFDRERSESYLREKERAKVVEMEKRIGMTRVRIRESQEEISGIEEQIRRLQFKMNDLKRGMESDESTIVGLEESRDRLEKSITVGYAVPSDKIDQKKLLQEELKAAALQSQDTCLLYTSPSPRDS